MSTTALDHNVIVPRAKGGPITDKTIHEITAIFARADAGQPCTEAEGELVAMAIGPLLEELLQRRATADLIAGLASGNVVLFPQPPASIPATTPPR